MTDFLAKSSCVLLIRVSIFASIFFVLGSDPSNDTRIFSALADKDLVEHIYGEGVHAQYPKLLPAILSIFSYLFGDHWFRVLVIMADLAIFTILYYKLQGFRGSIWEKAYIAGFFTAPLTAIWAQDEVVAVLPLVLMLCVNTGLWALLLFAVVSFFALKSFYIFLPFSIASSSRNLLCMAASLGVFAALYLLDHTGDFVPTNIFTSSLWYFSNFDSEQQKLYSTILFSGCAAVIFATSYFFNIGWKAAFTLVMSAFCQFFYHVNFEYYIFLTLPTLVLCMEGKVGRRTLTLCLLWFALAVSTNLFYALGYTVANLEIARQLHAASIVLAFFGGLLFIADFARESVRRRHSSNQQNAFVGHA